jgi:putative ribosome biogenesis GTPase RsgA
VELEEILEGKEGSLKKKSDEINYWKSQNEQMRGQLKQYYAEIESLEERCKFMESEHKINQKDVSHKENLTD